MAVLYYIHDPMCSWCWGFKASFEKLKAMLPENIHLQHLLGGLAKDSNQTMPLSLQHSIQQTWRTIQADIPGTKFNFKFWEQNIPRRSTYPSCRAVIAARQLNPDMEDVMITEIQTAYYLKALNPSDPPVLIELAGNIGLDKKEFETLLHSDAILATLDQEIKLSRKLGAQGFPSLILEANDKSFFIPIDYNHQQTILDTISHQLSASHR